MGFPCLLGICLYAATIVIAPLVGVVFAQLAMVFFAGSIRFVSDFWSQTGYFPAYWIAVMAEHPNDASKPIKRLKRVHRER